MGISLTAMLANQAAQKMHMVLVMILARLLAKHAKCFHILQETGSSII